MNRVRNALAAAAVLGFLTLWAAVMMQPPRQGIAQTYTPNGAVVATPTITIAGATADTTAVPSTGALVAHIQWKFGTVAGSYTTCTVQALTSFDGVTWLTLGTAPTITVTTGTVNAWDVIAQVPSSAGVTVSSVTTSSAIGFGQLTKYTFACSGGYGTGAPVGVTTIYK